MSYEVKEDIKSIDIENWSSFIYENPYGNIFQTPDFYNVYEKTDLYEPIVISVIDKNNSIVGILLVVIQKVINGKLGYFSSRAIIHGGPIVKNDDVEILDLLLKKLVKKIKNKAMITQFRNMRDWGSIKKVFLENGFKYDEHLNIIIDLTKSEDVLWKEVHSKRRNEIRRAKKKGTAFLALYELKHLKNSYDILVTVYKRAKLPLPPFSYFENIYNVSSKNFGLMIFGAQNKNRIIGCLLALVYKNTIYDFYAGSYKEEYSNYPNDLIPWEIFKWSKSKYKQFDFGGAGKPNIPYGVRDYKKKFGGKFVEHGRYEMINNYFIYKAVSFLFKIWQKIK